MVFYYCIQILGPKEDCFEEAILNELRQSRPVLPAIEEVDDDKDFAKYLVSLMKKLTNNNKLELQAEFVSKVINSIESELCFVSFNIYQLFIIILFVTFDFIVNMLCLNSKYKSEICYIIFKRNQRFILSFIL